MTDKTEEKKSAKKEAANANEEAGRTKPWDDASSTSSVDNTAHFADPYTGEIVELDEVEENAKAVAEKQEEDAKAKEKADEDRKGRRAAARKAARSSSSAPTAAPGSGSSTVRSSKDSDKSSSSKS